MKYRVFFLDPVVGRCIRPDIEAVGGDRQIIKALRDRRCLPAGSFVIDVNLTVIRKSDGRKIFQLEPIGDRS